MDAAPFAKTHVPQHVLHAVTLTIQNPVRPVTQDTSLSMATPMDVEAVNLVPNAVLHVAELRKLNVHLATTDTTGLALEIVSAAHLNARNAKTKEPDQFALHVHSTATLQLALANVIHLSYVTAFLAYALTLAGTLKPPSMESVSQLLIRMYYSSRMKKTTPSTQSQQRGATHLT